MRCLEALKRQDFPADQFEIIVVSDGEDPATGQALQAAIRRQHPVISYYELPAKSGPAAARNLGWTLAQAEFIAFTDDDCIPSERWLSSLWGAYQVDRQPEVAFSGRTIVPINKQPTDYEKNISQLASAEFITANCASTRLALERVGGFDERFRMAWREDSDLQFKYILNGVSIRKVNEAVVTHPVRKAPWGVSIREERKGMFNALLYKKYPKLYREKIERHGPLHYYAITLFLVVLLAGMISGKPSLKFTGFAGWVLLTSWFAYNRLRTTSRSWNHISEIVFTSAVIPILSLFWKFYGSLKFRSLRLP